MRIVKWLLCAALLIPATGCRDEAAQTPQGEDVTVVELALATPRHAHVLLENEYVLAAEFTIPPGEGLPSHYGRNRVVYALNDYRLQFDEPGERFVAESRAGDVSWHPAGEHSVKNVGDVEARYLVVIRKLSRLFEYSFTDAAEDFTCLAGHRSEVLLENEYMRVARFTLVPADKIPLHRGLNRVMYPLGDFLLRYETEAVQQDQPCAAGSVQYYGAENHAVANIGDTEAQYLMFELRQ